MSRSSPRTPPSSSSSDSSSLSSASSSGNSLSFYLNHDSEYSEKAFHNHVAMKEGKFKAFVKRAAKLKGSKETTISSTRGAELPADESQLSSADKTGSADPTETDAERAMYESERLDNFRWLSKLVGTYADCPDLTEKDIVDPEISSQVADIGQFAEVVYSTIEVKTLISSYAELKNEGVLLDYPILGECDFVAKVYGKDTELSAFVAYRRTTKQLVVSIAGSSTPKHAFLNLRAVRKTWRPSGPPPAAATPLGVDLQAASPLPNDSQQAETASTISETTAPKEKWGRVHTGFYKLYKDARLDFEQAIRSGIEEHNPDELVITGHSMGGSVSYLLCMDLLSPGDVEGVTASGIKLPPKLCLTTFGTPRSGNASLVDHFRKLVKEFRGEFREYSIKAFNDGVPAVPPRKMGYVHFCEKPLYAFKRRLYRVPDGQGEFSLFRVQDPENAGSNRKSRSSNANLSDSEPSLYRNGNRLSAGRWKNKTYSSSVQLTDNVSDGKQIVTIDANTTNSFPRGGHNYYNSRDLETFRRITDRLEKARFPEADWQTRFRAGGKRFGSSSSK